MREPSSAIIETNGGGVSSPPPQALLERLKDYGQEDVFSLWDELSHEERDFLVKDIEVSSFLPLVLQFYFFSIIENSISFSHVFAEFRSFQN